MDSYVPARPTKYCQTCASVIDVMAVVCPQCGVLQPLPPALAESDKRILPAFLLCLFLGPFGVHRFYAGKIGTGILELITFGGLGIWWLIDLIMIIAGVFRDSDGKKITEWD
ncbi:MAG TPA: TM2 domain-containing protein [Gemmatimonadaceae bacterium]|nr:TM2 domain-containing protein [Gemmatimonadaceae bacterium]